MPSTQEAQRVARNVVFSAENRPTGTVLRTTFMKEGHDFPSAHLTYKSPSTAMSRRAFAGPVWRSRSGRCFSRISRKEESNAAMRSVLFRQGSQLALLEERGHRGTRGLSPHSLLCVIREEQVELEVSEFCEGLLINEHMENNLRASQGPWGSPSLHESL